MGANRGMVADLELAQKLTEYNNQITQLFLQVSNQGHANDPRNPNSLISKQLQNQNYEDELLGCFRIQKEIEMLMTFFLERQQAEMNLLTEEFKQKALHDEQMLSQELSGLDDENHKLALHEQALYEELEKLKHDAQVLMDELFRHLKDIQNLISDSTQKMEKEQLSYFNENKNNLNMDLLSHFEHQNGELHVEVDGQKLRMKLDCVVNALHEAEVDEHRKIANGDVLVTGESLANRMRENVVRMLNADSTHSGLTPQMKSQAAAQVVDVVMSKNNGAKCSRLNIVAAHHQHINSMQMRAKLLLSEYTTVAAAEKGVGSNPLGHQAAVDMTRKILSDARQVVTCVLKGHNLTTEKRRSGLLHMTLSKTASPAAPKPEQEQHAEMNARRPSI
jgi:hypothetical protein